MAGVRPVSLPISSQEVTFIQRRQAELSRQINLIDQKVRSGVYSKSQGVNRKMFLKSEIDDLEYLKRSRRAPGSTPFTPFKLPQAPRAAGQSNKYQSTTSQSDGSTTVNNANKPYSTSTKPVNTGKKKTTIHDIPSKYGRKYGSILSSSEKKISGGYFYAYPVYSTKTRKMVNAYYGPVNAKTTTIQNFRNWCKINLGKEYTHYQPYKSTPTSKPQSKPLPINYTQNSTPRKSVKSNPFGKSYGPSVNYVEKTAYAGGAKPIKSGSYYYGPKYATYRKSWEAWNNKYVYGKPTSSRPKLISTKTVKDNPYTYRRTTSGYGTSIESYEQSLMNYSFKLGNNTMTIMPKAIKIGNYYYGPTHGQEVKWVSWMKANKLPYEISSKQTTSPTKTVGDNPHGQGYGPNLDMNELRLTGGVIKRHNGTVYGPKAQSKIGLWRAWNTANNIAGIEGRPVELIHKDAVKARREATLIRARRGARMDINKQVRGQRKTPNWKSIANDQEKRMVQQALTQVGLSDMPKLTEKGNRVLVQAIRTNRIENPQKRMEVGARRMSRILTDLINSSGYFSVKHKAKVSPSFPPQVQLSEMAGIAGGFSKTRNSMQRLLRK